MQSIVAMSDDTLKVIGDVESMLAPYRFRVCETEDQALGAYEVRRSVYADGCAYTVSIPATARKSSSA